MDTKKIKIAIDSPAGAGAGTQSKLISKHYNLFYLDTGKIYCILALYKLKYPNKFNLTYVQKKIKNIKLSELNNKKLLSNEIKIEASIISKNKKIEKKKETKKVQNEDIVEKLKDLKELLDTGVITSEEFKKAKKKLLN